jgi:hypothetical protein
MAKDITKLLWYHDSHFIKEDDLDKDSPEKIIPKPIGEPFQISYPLDKDSLKNQMKERYPEANAYTEGIVSMGGFSEGIYQAYKI